MRDALPAWANGLPVAVTIADADGVILEMNERARETFAKEGGAALVGRSLFDCHPEPARTKLRALYERREPSHYTIRKKGQRKIIHQLPWHVGGLFAGFVEISIPLPDELAHFERS